MNKASTSETAMDRNGTCPFASQLAKLDEGVPVSVLIQRALTIQERDLDSVSTDEMMAFYKQIAHEARDSGVDWCKRCQEVCVELGRTGSYRKTAFELTFAARVAWRNSIRCIGRLHWKSLKVRDLRHLTEMDDVFEALVEHLRIATNGGAIIPTMSVFAPAKQDENWVSILNYQLIRYAGYRNARGEVLGDAQNADLTDMAISLGWRPPHERSKFDVLPILLKTQSGRVAFYDLPSGHDIILEVPIRHPQYPWFESLGLKWYAVPAICNMVLDAGGLKYPTIPFNGWYMATEIASRNFADERRYNMLPVIGEKLGFQIRNHRTLWKDKALVELNIAVLHSYERAGIKIVDHHSASRQFVEFEARESAEGRRVCGDWSWLVPPLSGSASPVFHRAYSHEVVKPGLFYLEKFAPFTIAAEEKIDPGPPKWEGQKMSEP